ncbi:MAG: O-antigen ligase family protein [Paludibacteraceae bacterium]|nr:O-antigen ligase family protein [Paludibacteraceae bacterium]
MLANIKIKDILFFVVVVLLWFTAYAHYQGESMNHLALYVVTPLAVLLTMVYRFSFRVGRWFGILMILYIWVGLMSFFAFDRGVAMEEMHRILGCILFSFIVASLAQERKHVTWLYLLYVILFACAIGYAQREILPYITLGEGRVTDDNLNANTLAYYTFFYSFITFLLGEIAQKTKWKTFWHIVFFSSIPIIYGVAIATASRQVFVICAPMVALMLVYRYLINKATPKWQKWVSIIVIVIALAGVVPKALEIYQGSELSARNEMSVKDDERMVLLKESIQVGCEHPLFGVGPGNFRLFSSPHLFSHNTYTELFANTGIIGALIYIFMVCAFCWVNWKRWRQTHDSLCFSFLLFGCFYALYQFFYVFYADNWLISFFILVCTHSDVYYNDCYANTTDTHSA